MELEVITEIHIYRPVTDVFEIILDTDKMSVFFLSSASSLIGEGTDSSYLNDEKNALSIEIENVVQDQLIQFKWTATLIPTSVLLTFTPITHTSTLLKVVEGHWDKNSDGLRAYAQQMQTWTYFNVRLKLFLEHGLYLDSFLSNPGKENS